MVCCTEDVGKSIIEVTKSQCFQQNNKFVLEKSLLLFQSRNHSSRRAENIALM